MNLPLLFILLINPTPREGTVTINRTYDVQSPEKMLVMISNTFGSVAVEPSDDGKVHVLLKIKIDAPTEALLAKAKRELKLGEYLAKDTLIFYTNAPFLKNCDEPPFMGSQHDGPEYSFTYEYKIQIPEKSNVHARTVNNGDVFVRDIQGGVTVNNVNGAVSVKNAHQLDRASTVNGDITINFVNTPKESIAFHTVNGDFNLTFPRDFAAKIYFKSLNGEMYSSFDYKTLNPRASSTKNSKGTKFKVGSKTGVEIGSGGPTLSFDSINGNVYLKN